MCRDCELPVQWPRPQGGGYDMRECGVIPAEREMLSALA